MTRTVQIGVNSTFRHDCGTVRFVHRRADNSIEKEWTQTIDSHITRFWGSLVWAWATGVGTPNLGASPYNIRGAVTTTNGTRGICVGAGNTAVAYGDTGMETPILYGTQANRLTASVSAESFDFSTGVGTTARTFTNQNATTTPTVRECGINASDLNSGTNITIVRDVLAAPVTLLLGESIDITYTISFGGQTENWARLIGNHFHCRTNVQRSFINMSGTVTNSTGTGDRPFNSLYAPPFFDSAGIVVGSGSTAVAWGDYALDSPISNGDGAGQLVYFASIVPPQSSLDDTTGKTIIVSRMFENRGASNVTIAEIGLQSNVDASPQYPVLFNRHVLSSPVTVPVGGFVVASWAIQYNFNS